MTTPSPSDVTQLLISWGKGDEGALKQLMPLVYQELQRMARRHLGRERAGHTLQTPGTVMRDWTLAKTWLQREIDKGGNNAG